MAPSAHFLRFARSAAIVRRSHLLEHQRQGYIFSALRAFFLIWPLSATGVGGAAIQAITASLLWGCILLIATPLYTSISFTHTIPAIPLSRAACLSGALIALRWWEPLPVATLFVYRLTEGTLPTPISIATIIAVLSGSFGIIRAGVDDLAYRWPSLFYRAPLAIVLLTPIIIGAIGTQVGMDQTQASTIPTAVLLSLMPLYLGMSSPQGQAFLTITVPDLSTNLYRKQVTRAVTLVLLGSAIGFFFLDIPPLFALIMACATASIAALWLGLAWGGRFLRCFALFLVLSVPAGIVTGIAGASTSYLALAVIAGIAACLGAAAVLRLRTLTDRALSPVLSYTPK